MAIEHLIDDWLPRTGLDAHSRDAVRRVLEDERDLLASLAPRSATAPGA